MPLVCKVRNAILEVEFEFTDAEGCPVSHIEPASKQCIEPRPSNYPLSWLIITFYEKPYSPYLMVLGGSRSGFFLFVVTEIAQGTERVIFLVSGHKPGFGPSCKHFFCQASSGM